ncbi:hypothetical protein [Lelliottia amnigena]|uniref:hypothetical protein n=1 Tax=Lelliottia amnigena TaxID=61646 RepID=UPI003F54C437
MKIYPPNDARTFPVSALEADLLVAGGGLAGLCAALAAARDVECRPDSGPPCIGRKCLQRSAPLGQWRDVAHGQ